MKFGLLFILAAFAVFIPKCAGSCAKLEGVTLLTLGIAYDDMLACTRSDDANRGNTARCTLACLKGDMKIDLYCDGANWKYAGRFRTTGLSFPEDGASPKTPSCPEPDTCRIQNQVTLDENLYLFDRFGAVKRYEEISNACSPSACEINCSGDSHVEVNGRVPKSNHKSFLTQCFDSEWYYYLSGLDVQKEGVKFPATNGNLEQSKHIPRCVAHCSFGNLQKLLTKVASKNVSHLKFDTSGDFVSLTGRLPITVDSRRFYLGNDRIKPTQVVAMCDGDTKSSLSWKLLNPSSRDGDELKEFPAVHPYCTFDHLREILDSKKMEIFTYGQTGAPKLGEQFRVYLKKDVHGGLVHFADHLTVFAVCSSRVPWTFRFSSDERSRVRDASELSNLKTLTAEEHRQQLDIESKADDARELKENNLRAQRDQGGQCPPLPDLANMFVKPVEGQCISRAADSTCQMECVAGSHLEVADVPQSLADNKFWLGCLNDPKSTENPLQWRYRDLLPMMKFPSTNFQAPVCRPHCEMPSQRVLDSLKKLVTEELARQGYAEFDELRNEDIGYSSRRTDVNIYFKYNNPNGGENNSDRFQCVCDGIPEMCHWEIEEKSVEPAGWVKHIQNLADPESNNHNVDGKDDLPGYGAGGALNIDMTQLNGPQGDDAENPPNIGGLDNTAALTGDRRIVVEEKQDTNQNSSGAEIFGWFIFVLLILGLITYIFLQYNDDWIQATPLRSIRIDR
eukprot:444358_1